MGIPRKPDSVMLFTGIICKEEILSKIHEILSPLGEIEERSDILNFDDFSKYYQEEMGEGLKRLWLTFKGLRTPENMHILKLVTNKIEESFTINNKRTINIDPGYISLANVILYSTKSYFHRIYVSDGIYAEVTLFFKKKEGFQPFPWTYPDYKTLEAVEFFNKARNRLYTILRDTEIR
ncbi:MAG: DUF4416 family protein [Candidatus Hydrothermia bacterium]